MQSNKREALLEMAQPTIMDNKGNLGVYNPAFALSFTCRLSKIRIISIGVSGKSYLRILFYDRLLPSKL